ncbi:MAG: anaerobic ribonucleoside-triphosphate reductase [Alphaproteobacteria bacterium]
MTEKELLEKYESERQPVECWTRVMGYFRPVSQFNKGKKSEFAERVWFLESDTCTCSAQKAA